MGSLVCFSYHPLSKHSVLYFVAASDLAYRKKMKMDAVFEEHRWEIYVKGVGDLFPQAEGRSVAIERFLGIGKET